MGKNWLWLVGTCLGLGLDCPSLRWPLYPQWRLIVGKHTAVGSGALYWPFSRLMEVNRGHFQPNGG